MSLITRYTVQSQPASQTTYNEAYITRKVDEAARTYASVKLSGTPAQIETAWQQLQDAKDLLKASVR